MIGSDEYQSALVVRRNESILAGSLISFDQINFFSILKLVSMKAFTKATVLRRKLSGILFTCLLFFSACQKEINHTSPQEEVAAVANNNSSNSKKIYVSNIDQLYNAINNVDNAGSTVVLAPGTYLLSVAYPNGGRLELKYNMSIQGQPGHPEQVIIDASVLPASSFSIPPHPAFPGAGRTGVIRLGNGSNAVEWLTAKGCPLSAAVSVIETDLITTAVTNIRVAHCIVYGGQIGIDIRNRDPEANGRIINTELIDNELTENLVGFGQGIGIQNSRDVFGAAIYATLRNNYVHGNRMGMRAYNIVANQSTITIRSTDDRFEENGLGLALLGAFNEYPNFTAHDNSLNFEAHGTTIINNQGLPSPPTGTAQVIPGGILVTGAHVSVNSLPGTSSRNNLEISLTGCRIENNLTPFDINAFGARSGYPSSNPAGTNNIVNIYLNGISVNATENAINSFPIEPAGTNVVNIFR